MVKKLIFLFALFFFCSTAFALTYEVVKVDSCQMFGFSSEKRQTDHDAFSTAAGTRPQWGTVAANHLPLWTRMKIDGFGEQIFTVEDRMNARYTKAIDVWFPNTTLARKFGARNRKYWIVRKVRPLPKNKFYDH